MEKNKDILQKAILELPVYSAPDDVWRNIDIEFNLSKQEKNRDILSAAAVGLPTYQAPEESWKKIVRKMDKPDAGIQWIRYAAAAAFLFFVKGFKLFAGISAPVKVAFLLSGAAATMTTVYLYKQSSENQQKPMPQVINNKPEEPSFLREEPKNPVENTGQLEPEFIQEEERYDNNAMLDIFSEKNLIQNPSFEEFVSLPFDKISNRSFFQNLHWSVPTFDCPNIFSSSVPESSWANFRQRKIKPRTGEIVIGINTYSPKGSNGSHEYIQSKLKYPLIPGIRYYAELWVRRSPEALYASNNIGMYFSDTLVFFSDQSYRKQGEKISSPVLHFSPQIKEQKIIINSDRWTRISGVFTPNKPLQYVIIGNFYTDYETQIGKFPKSELEFKGAYYYIDDILVMPIESMNYERKIKNQFSQRISALKAEPIFFAKDSSDIPGHVYKRLNDLIEMLHTDPLLKVEINGYSFREKSSILAEERARMVYSYFIANGIPKHRIKMTGKKLSNIYISEGSEEVYNMNRKVEIIIRKK